MRLPDSENVPAPLSKIPPIIRRSHGRCEDPPGLKNPRSVPAPEGVGPFVKVSPEGDPAAPGGAVVWPGPAPLAGAMVVVVPVCPSWPTVVGGMDVDVEVVDISGAVLDVGVNVVDVVVVPCFTVVEVVVPSSGVVLDVGVKVDDVVVEPCLTVVVVVVPCLTVVVVVVPCFTVVVVVPRVVVGAWQGSYQNTLYLSSDPIEPVTSTSTLM
jgi:hypothetical protein